MFFRKSKLIRELKEEIQRLREMLTYVMGQRDSARQGYEGMKEVAEKALDAAKEKQFPQIVKNQENVYPGDLWINGQKVQDGKSYLSDPDPYSVKHCPECNVSVRSDSWPMECPACHCTFGFEEAK